MTFFAQLPAAPTSRLERHLQAAGWGGNDRSIQEMRAMVEVFELAIFHDQLNVASAAAFESLGGRWRAMLGARAENPTGPGPEIAKKSPGYDRRRQLVAPTQRPSRLRRRARRPR
eukprot:3431014-Pyramimonas_sp.AAC.1